MPDADSGSSLDVVTNSIPYMSKVPSVTELLARVGNVMHVLNGKLT